MKLKLFIAVVLAFTFSNVVYSQSKKELKKQVAELRSQNKDLSDQLSQIEEDRSTLRERLDRISNIEVDDVITPEEQPSNIVIGEGGWRVDLNGNKYKSDLIGQLGTIWVVDSNNQIQPQGGISLTDYGIEPRIINQEGDILYKKFISKGTQLEGDGKIPFASITASLGSNQYSQFSISIDGTSQVIPSVKSLRKVASEANDLFSIEGVKGVVLCTGMHIVKYHSNIYSKNEGEGQINSPVVNIGGSFYSENTEESSEYLVVRQFTQLNQQSAESIEESVRELKALNQDGTGSIQSFEQAGVKFSPVEVLSYFLDREPSTEELIQFQNNPEAFLSSKGVLDGLSSGERTLLDANKTQLLLLPNEVKSVEKI